MADDLVSPTRSPLLVQVKGGGSSSGANEMPPLRHRAMGRAATFGEVSGSGSSRAQRRGSLLSDFSLEDARNSIRSSTDDLLLPKAQTSPAGSTHEPSVWHSSPLAFALLPAVGGMLFKNGSAVITDVTLLGLAGVFLNWSVRLPWDWYHSAQSIATRDPYPSDAIIEESEEEEDEEPEEMAGDGESSPAGTRSPDDAPRPKPAPKIHQARQPRASAEHELRTHEILALTACFLFPLLGAYLLHTIRGQLSRPSEGLVSDYNLTIFVLAAEIRPLAHLVKIIQTRTLFLQRLVNENPYVAGPDAGGGSDLSRRLERVEARVMSGVGSANGDGGSPGSSKDAGTVTTEVRRTLQPDLDALNRAVRRYEKRATMQTMQTESRLLDLEARLSDALALAAAAAQSGQRQRQGFAVILIDWMCAAVVLPLQALWAIMNLPLTALTTLFGFVSAATPGRKRGRERRSGVATARYGMHGRLGGERIQARGLKKT
ncbi:MAG: hypothetical protein M1832_006251 [Thelocarpon impressellum]|nr:MAG: hypothetical protein M1832_006251 [Thelocarpon impressellum]